MANAPNIEINLLMQSICESSADAMRVTDNKGLVINVNKSYCSLTGFEKNSLIGKPFNIVYDKGEQKESMKIHSTFLSGNIDSERSERKVKFSNGSQHHLEATYSKIKIKNNDFVLSVFRDITSFMESANEVSKNKEKYKNLYSMISLMCDNSPDMIWAKDLNNNYIFANKAMCDNLLIAKDTDEPIGKNDMFFAQRQRDAHKDNPNWHTFGEICRDSDSIVLKNKRAEQFDEYGNVKGKFLFLDVRKAPIFDEQGNIIGVVGSGRDVTLERQYEKDLMQAQNVLKNSEVKFRSIVESSNEIIIKIDVQGNFIFISKAAEEITGFKISDYLGKSFAPLVHPDDLQTANKGLIDALGGIQSRYEVRIFNSKGEIIYLELNTSPVIDNGKITGIVSFCRDITKQRLAEEKLQLSETTYRGILNNVTEAVYILDEEGKFIDVNVTSEKMYGYEREYFFGKTPEFLSATGKNDMEKVVEFLKEALNGKPQLFEFWGLKKDGTVFPKDVSVTAGTYFGKKVVIAVARDISERKNTEEELIAIEKQQSLIFKSLPVVIYTAPVDPEIDAFWISEGIITVTGFTREEYLAEQYFWRKRIHPDDAERTIDVFKNIQHLNEINVEYRWKIKSGEYRWFLDKAVINKTESGSEYFGVLLDITESKEIEKALIESEERYKAMVANIDQLVIEFDEKGTYLNIWADDESLLVDPEKERSGKTITEVLGEELARPFLERIQRVMSTGKPELYEYPLDVVGGSRWFAGRINPIFTADSKIKTVSFIARDITNRKKAEEILKESESQFRNLLHDIHSIAVQGYAPDGTTMYWNPASEKLYGYTAEEAIGKNLLDLIIPPEMRDAVKQAIKQMAETGQPFPASELSLMRKDGSRVSVYSSHTIVKIHGLPNELFCIDLDLTDFNELKLKEKEILLKNSELEKLNSEKDKFFSIIAHDLRGPFTGFLGFTEMMMNDINSMTLSELMDIAHRLNKSADNLFNLLNNLLEWAMMQRGLTSFLPESNNFKNIVDECIKSETHLLQQKEISLDTDIPDNLSVFVDRKMVDFTIRNLIANAIKFTNRKGNITISATSENENEVKICVSDNGIGMDKNLVNDLFKISSKVKRSGTEKEPSTGLGLILCKEFVTKNGGTISVESEEGKGSKFCIILKKQAD